MWDGILDEFFLIIMEMLGEFDFSLVLLMFLTVWDGKMGDFKLSENLVW